MNDYGAAYLWQRTTQSITVAVKYLPMDSTLEHALGSIPIGGMPGVPQRILEAPVPKLAELSEPAIVFAPGYSFLATPATAAVIVEECLCLLPKEEMACVPEEELAGSLSR